MNKWNNCLMNYFLDLSSDDSEDASDFVRNIQDDFLITFNINNKSQYYYSGHSPSLSKDKTINCLFK